jgi:hypothetical protein
MFSPKDLPLVTEGSFPFNFEASSRKAAPLFSLTRKTVQFEAELSGPFFVVGSASTFSVGVRRSSVNLLFSIFALNGPGPERTEESFLLPFPQAGNFRPKQRCHFRLDRF